MPNTRILLILILFSISILFIFYDMHKRKKIIMKTKKHITANLINEFTDGTGNTYSVLDYGKYIEIVLVIANIYKHKRKRANEPEDLIIGDKL